MFTLIDALERKPKGKPDMSPHAVNTFVSDLVQMAQAMERLPQIEADLREAHSTIYALEQRLIDRAGDLDQVRTYTATLEQRLHDAEVAKDAAETMFLEADERTSRALDFVKTVFGSAGSLIQALEPPRTTKPVVEQTVQQETIPSWATPEVDHTGDYIPKVSEVKPIGADPIGNSSAGQSQHEGPQGQSEPDPTIAPTPISNLSDTSVSNASTVESGLTNPELGPYFGKRYYDHPIYVPLDAWLAGGGTEEDYHWRPDTPKPSPYLGF